MFNVESIGASVRRRVIPICCVTVLCACIGAFVAFQSSSEESNAARYAAEAALFVSGYDESEEGSSYNYLADNDKLISDARRAVVSNEVAGAVRAELGDEVKISSPFWMNPKTKSVWYTRYVFVHAEAPTQELAVEAAQLAAEKAELTIAELPIVSDVFVSSDAAPVAPSEDAADFGTGSLDPAAEIDRAVGSSFSMKKVLVFAVMGFVASAACFVAYDILSMRVRSKADAERIFGVEVLGVVDKEGIACASVVDDVVAVARKHGFESVASVGGVPEDGAEFYAEKIKGAGIASTPLTLSLDFDDMTSKLSQASSAVVVLSAGRSSGHVIRGLRAKLCIAETPVIGVILCESK